MTLPALAARTVQSGYGLSARFEQLDGHRSLLVDWQPPAPAKAMALFVPAFGDEMNQSRRMVRLAAEALAQREVASVVFDLYGTGDSSADFDGATLERWLADCRTVAERVRVRASAEAPLPLILVGCRLGAGLAVQLSHELPEPAALLVGWAPVLQGRLQLSALLRAASVARMQRPDESADDPKTRWAAGEGAMLGGYPVSAVLAGELERFDATGAPRASAVALIDVRLPAADESVTATENTRRRAAVWSADGVPTSAQAVAGAGFWNVADLVDVPELVDATVQVVEEVIGGAPA